MINPGVITQGAVTPGNAAVFVNRNMIKDGGVAPTVAGLLGWIDVYSYLTPAQQASVSLWTGTDVTAGVTAAIAAIPSTGGVLYFRPGKWVTTGGFTLANPTFVIGCTGGDYSNTGAVTQIVDTVTNNVLFNVTAIAAKFEDISLVCSGVGAAGSTAVKVVNASALNVCNFDQVTFDGFYDTVDVQTGYGWQIDNCEIVRSVHWALRIRNTVNADAGGWHVTNSQFAPLANAAAGIRIESGGGGVIANNKIVSDSGLIVDGISMDVGAAPTVQLSICDNNIESVSGSCINIVSGWPRISINSNLLDCSLGTGPGITASAVVQLNVQANTLNGPSAGTAISLTSCTQPLVGPNNIRNFTDKTAFVACTLILDIDDDLVLTNVANTFTVTQTITPALDTQALIVSGFSADTADTHSIIDISGTWNVGGGNNAGDAFRLNITNTSSAGASNLLNLLVGGVSFFSVNRLGFMQCGQMATIGGNIFGYSMAASNIYIKETTGTVPTILMWGNGANFGAMGINAGEGFWLGSSSNAVAITNQAVYWDSFANVALGLTGALATTATDGDMYIPTCAGPPTGVPRGVTGKVAVRYDTTNNKLYIYNGGWKGGTNPGVFT